MSLSLSSQVALSVVVRAMNRAFQSLQLMLSPVNTDGSAVGERFMCIDSERRTMRCLSLSLSSQVALSVVVRAMNKAFQSLQLMLSPVNTDGSAIGERFMRTDSARRTMRCISLVRWRYL